MAFPPSFLERLRSTVPLNELIGKRVNLRKNGREWSGLCPFHNEKSASFRVYEDHYHCFGCGAHGDAIEFLKSAERLNYREAVEKLANLAGVPLPDITPAQAQRAQAERGLHAVLEEAAKCFERELMGNRGLAARGYLESRGIKQEAIRNFRIGYAPDMRDGLKTTLINKGVSEQLLLAAGLIGKTETGSTYDRFRGRLMFPIRDTSGRVIAFGGRILSAAQANVPKYLNSPETPLFKKGETIYNLNLAAGSARTANEIILVEGYMDVVGVAQAGVEQVVATLGTAITAEQLKRLWQYADAPVLCLDGDTAGLRASQRAAEIALPLLTPGKSLKFALMPGGEDPDSLIAKFGVERFRDSVTHARELHDMLWGNISAQYSSPAPAARAALEKRLETLTSTIQDTGMRTHFKSFFKQKMWESQPGKSIKGKRKEIAPASRSPLLATMAKAPSDSPQAQTLRQIFKILLLQPELLQEDRTEEHLTRLECVSDALDSLRAALLAGCPSEDCQQLLSSLNGSGFAHIIASLLKDDAVLIPREALESVTAARQWLERLMEAHDLALLEAEYHAVEQQFAVDQGSEALLSRMFALQKELQERKAERLKAYLSYGEES